MHNFTINEIAFYNLRAHLKSLSLHAYTLICSHFSPLRSLRTPLIASLHTPSPSAQTSIITDVTLRKWSSGHGSDVNKFRYGCKLIRRGVNSFFNYTLNNWRSGTVVEIEVKFKFGKEHKVLVEENSCQPAGRYFIKNLKIITSGTGQDIGIYKLCKQVLSTWFAG